MQNQTNPNILPSQADVQAQINTFKRDQGPKKIVITAFLLIAGLVVTAGILTTVQLAQTNQDVRSLAAIEPRVTFNFGRPQISMQDGQTSTVEMLVSTQGNKLVATNLAFSFDPEYIEVLSITPSERLPSILQAAAIDNSAGNAKITMAAQLPTTAGQDTTLVGESVPLAAVSFKAKKPSTLTKIQFIPASLQAALLGSQLNAATIGTNLDVTVTSTEPTPVPTPTPTPAPTPPPTTPEATKLTPSFYIQGLSKAAVTINDVAVTLRYKGSDNNWVVKSYSVPFTSRADGLLATTINISDMVSLPAGQSLAGVEVYVKAPTSLRGKLGTVTIVGGASNIIANDGDLIVGDFVRNGNEANKIKLNDIAKALTAFKDLENPVTDSNREFDVDYNGTFNLQDIAFVLQNYDSLEYPGEQL